MLWLCFALALLGFIGFMMFMREAMHKLPSPESARYALQPLNVIDLVAVAPGLPVMTEYVSLRFSHDTTTTTSGVEATHQADEF